MNASRNIIMSTSNIMNVSRISSLVRLMLIPRRFLLSKESLRLDQYEMQRLRTSQMFPVTREHFFTQMLETFKNQTIHEEHVQATLHFAGASDIDFVMKLLDKYTSQLHNDNLPHFGPILMRLFHHLDLPDQALQCYEEMATSTLFDQQSSHLILYDLLFKRGCYADILRVYEAAKTKRKDGKHLNNQTVLLMAACYKLESEQSMQFASELWNKMEAAKFKPMKRTCLFYAALALKQSTPHVALKVLETLDLTVYERLNFKSRALACSRQLDKALEVLSDVLYADTPRYTETYKHIVLGETMRLVEMAISKSGIKHMERKFVKIQENLKRKVLIDPDSTIDEYLTRPLTLQTAEMLNEVKASIKVTKQRHIDGM